MLVILMGKCAAGKDTMQKTLMKRGYIPIVSSTTRKPRVGEVDGEDYHFITKEEFLDQLTSGEIFEYRRFDSAEGTKYYGARKIDLSPDKNYVTVLDPGGVKEYLKAYGAENCFVVYLEVDASIRKERSMTRGSMSEQEWEDREKDEDTRFDWWTVLKPITDIQLNNEGNIEKIADVLEEYMSLTKGNTTVSFKVWCQASYTSTMTVPRVLIHKEDALFEYVRDHLDQAPLGMLDYLPDSDELDPEDCNITEIS